MAKSTNGGKTKATTGETKARRAPARRRTDKPTAQTPVAVASELAAPEQAAPAAGMTRAVSAEASNLNLEEVRRRAYEIYCGRGRGDGSAEGDWLEAERQLRNGRRTH